MRLLKTKLKVLRSCISKLYNIRIKEHQTKIIEELVERRDENFIDEPSLFISSALSRKKRYIVLDRVLVDTPNGQQLFTDPDIVKKETVKHFEHFVKTPSHTSTNIQNLPDRWQRTYAPLNQVHSSIYDSLLLPITDNELRTVLSTLPKK